MILKRLPVWIMPKYWLSHQTTYKRWLSIFALAIIVGGFCFLTFQKLWLALLIIVIMTILCICVYPTNKITHEEKLKKLALQRTGLNISDFACEFDVRLTNTWVVRVVYEAFSTYLKRMYPLLDGFSIKADDELTVLFDQRSDFESEVFDTVAERIQIYTIDEYGEKVNLELMTTVRDVVAFFNVQLRLQKDINRDGSVL